MSDAGPLPARQPLASCPEPLALGGRRMSMLCDALNIPPIIFEDVPGFLPGVGQEHDVMNSKHIRGGCDPGLADLEIAVMGPKGAVEVLFRKEFDMAEDPEAATEDRIAEYRAEFSHPYIAAARGYIDDVIDPRTTRLRLISTLDMLRNKRDENPRKKHGDVPL